jgi:hypothetical protein
MPHGVPAFQMRTIKDCATIARSSRATIVNRMRAWDDVAAKGETPPQGALRSVRWCGKRLVADERLRESLGLDAPPVPAPPPARRRRITTPRRNLPDWRASISNRTEEGKTRDHHERGRRKPPRAVKRPRPSKGYNRNAFRKKRARSPCRKREPKH